MSQTGSEWWRTGVVYQVYLRSFADGDGDGQGDIAGLRSRLDHLDALGVDAIWLNPWYVSPLADGGYDVADYRDIEPRYGTLDEAEALIAECHERGIKVIADLVPNHTSSEHAWFQEALAAPPGDPARDRYIFRPGRGPDGSEPPNNWRAVFGGPAWQRVDDGDWYLHLFDVTQPDLNWENPEVADEFDAIIRFWLDRGVDGLRIDVAHGMVKDPAFPDIEDLPVAHSLLEREDRRNHPYWDRPGVHEINRRWRAILDEYDERMMVAEAWVPAESLPLYLRPDEYHQSFNFDLLETPWRADAFAKVIADSAQAAAEVGASNTWVLSNHDVMRHATRYGLPETVSWRAWPLDGPHDVLDVDAGDRRARAAALITLSLPGSTYIYQGEELGLPEVWDLPAEVLDDPTWQRSNQTQKGRDGCRVPIPWSTDGPSYGFGEGAAWLPQPDVYGRLAVDAQQDQPGSMLTLYRQAIAARRDRFIGDDSLELVDLGPDVLAYRRSDTLVVVNMGEQSIPLPDGEVLLASTPDDLDGSLPADTAVWLRS